MGYAEDLVRAKRMKAHLERFGVKVSIELQAGAGGSWSIGTHRFIMSHHTASWPWQGPTPALNIVKLGRPDVPGPLANGYGGYDLVYRILTFGRANHPGAGGPWTAGGYTMPKDNARAYAWGTEFEGGYETYSPEMRDFMARVNAGLTSYFAEEWGKDVRQYVEMNLEHKDWAPLRKPDRKDITRAISMTEITRVLQDHDTEEDDMFTDEDRERLVKIHAKSDQTFHGVDQIGLPSLKRVERSLYALRHETLPALEGKVTGLLEAVSLLSDDSPFTLEEIEAAAARGGEAGAKAAITPEAISETLPTAIAKELFRILGERPDVQEA